MSYKKSHVIRALRNVIFPDKGQNIVELEMVENINVSSQKVSFDVVLPAFNNPHKDSIKEASIKAVKENLSSGLQVEPNITSRVEFNKLKEEKPLSQVKNIIAVASGKGGVGKSTVAVNLAVSLANKGLNVGLIDADMFGPSIPKMFNAEDARPMLEKVDGKDRIKPVEKYGVKMLSIGFFVKKEDATIWRGPMASNALKQLINDGNWGELDYLVVDMPPGTSDIHLTMVQTVAVTGAVIVSTPQAVALADAIKGINMFNNKGIEVPVLGIVENMAWFTPEELPENKYFIFGEEGAKKLAQERNVNFLGQIPIVQSIREGGDNGTPAAANADSIVGTAFAELADKVIDSVKYRNENIGPTNPVEIKH